MMARPQKDIYDGPSALKSSALLQSKQGGSMQFQDDRVSNASVSALQTKLQEDRSTSLKDTALLQAKIQQSHVAQFKASNGGLPSQLRAGIESLSGMSMSGVKVNYNSSKPKQLQAHAYAQGSSIHLGPGQEKHLPHEAWHVVQQAQGRVKPTMQMAKVNINDDKGLEGEADRMGAKALSIGKSATQRKPIAGRDGVKDQGTLVQRKGAKYKGKKKLK